MKSKNAIGLVVLSLLMVAGPVLADGPATFKVSTLTFARPASWEWVEVNSAMRKAQLRVPDANNKTACEVIFYHFGAGDGGGTKANVERWFGQFAEARDKINAKSEEVTINKHKVTYVHAEGTYKSGMPGGPTTAMENYALEGVIIEADGGNIFIRMTRPKELVASSVAEFRKMVESAFK